MQLEEMSTRASAEMLDPRQALTKAQARVSLYERDLAVNADAQAETSEAIAAAETKLEAARAAAGEQTHARSLADVHSAIEDTRKKRLAFEDAEETLSELKLHRDRLEVQAEQLRTSLGYARSNLDTAVAAVAWPVVESVLLGRYKSLQRELMSLAGTIRSFHGVIPPSKQYWDATRIEHVQIDLAWPRWIEALHKDAAAPPPEGFESHE